MADDGRILADSGVIVVIDWPTRDVPDSLALAGYTVFVKDGPGDDDYSAYDLAEGKVVVLSLGSRPADADLVYVYRPADELPRDIEIALALGASAVWVQSGLASDGTADPRGTWMPVERSAAGRQAVEAAGLAYLEQPFIADVARAHPHRPRR
jgi:predicted CoA-binding protein